MKKIDKLIITSFLGPFILTFVVVVFILLTVHMLRYFDDIMGKDLGFAVLGRLFFYFGVFVTPTSIPLAVLLSSLMTFGNLGEHFELTAIKSAGISLVRALLPIFIFVLGLTVLAYYSNNYFVPRAALEAYSLLYDIKQKKPALDLKEGTFYNGIPDFSIKVNKTHPDGITLEDIIIYDHRDQSGNKKVTLADSGLMQSIMNDNYLKLELFRGNFYIENSAVGSGKKRSKTETLSRSSFSQSEYILDLSSFGLDRTDQSLFEGNRIMRNLSQLTDDVDSMSNIIMDRKLTVFDALPNSFYYHLKHDTVQLPSYLSEYKQLTDSLELMRLTKEREDVERKADSLRMIFERMDLDSIYSDSVSKIISEQSITVETGAGKSTADYERDNRIRILEEKMAKRAKDKLADINFIKHKPELTEKPLAVDKDEKLKLDEAQQEVELDSIKLDSIKLVLTKVEFIDSLKHSSLNRKDLQTPLSLARQAKSKLQTSNTRLDRMRYDQDVFEIQWHKIIANSVACIVMFLIGAPLGAIIKRGGLGMPVLISIVFFILFYVISLTGEKWAKRDVIDPMIGLWSANGILFPLGLFFLRQARNDVRILEADFYSVLLDKLKVWISKFKSDKARK